MSVVIPMSVRPHSLLVPHVRLCDTHGWIGTGPGCLACVEHHGPDYADQGPLDDKEGRL